MKRNLHLVGGVLLVAVAAWLVDAAQLSPRAAFDAGDRSRIDALVEGRRALEISVLEARAGLSSSFDPVNRAAATLRAAASDAEAVGARGSAYAAAAAEISLVAIAVEREETALEQFKTDLALMRLSSRYFPVAADSLLRRVEALAPRTAVPPDTLVHIATLRTDIERYEELHARDVARRLELVLPALQSLRASLDDVARSELDALRGHARAILDRRERVDSFTHTLVHSPIRGHLEAARAQYERATRIHVRKVDALRLLAGLLAVGGLAVLASVAMRASRGHAT